jgi:hypothetical protein
MNRFTPSEVEVGLALTAVGAIVALLYLYLGGSFHAG